MPKPKSKLDAAIERRGLTSSPLGSKKRSAPNKKLKRVLLALHEDILTDGPLPDPYN